MFWQTRLGYSCIIRYCIDIDIVLPATLFDSESDPEFVQYDGNSRNCLTLLD